MEGYKVDIRIETDYDFEVVLDPKGSLEYILIREESKHSFMLIYEKEEGVINLVRSLSLSTGKPYLQEYFNERRDKYLQGMELKGLYSSDELMGGNHEFFVHISKVSEEYLIG